MLLPQNGGFDFPHWHVIVVTALQLHSPGLSHGPGPEAKSCTFLFFVLSPLSFIQQTNKDDPKKKTHTESSGTHLLNVKGKEKKQVHEKKVKRAINTLAEDVMLMINALCQCSNLHQCLEVCEGEYNISLSQ